MRLQSSRRRRRASLGASNKVSAAHWAGPGEVPRELRKAPLKLIKTERIIHPLGLSTRSDERSDPLEIGNTLGRGEGRVGLTVPRTLRLRENDSRICSDPLSAINSRKARTSPTVDVIKEWFHSRFLSLLTPSSKAILRHVFCSLKETVLQILP